MSQNNIKPQELRLGNYIKADDNIICQVVRIESNEFTEWNSGDNYSIISKKVGTNDNYLNCLNDNWQPIPLSEEVLLKAGFYHRGSGFYCLDINDWSNIQIHFYKGESVAEISVQKHSFVVKCKHLHQLQNLFYSLTQTELEVSWI